MKVFPIHQVQHALFSLTCILEIFLEGHPTQNCSNSDVIRFIHVSLLISCVIVVQISFSPSLSLIFIFFQSFFQTNIIRRMLVLLSVPMQFRSSALVVLSQGHRGNYEIILHIGQSHGMFARERDLHLSLLLTSFRLQLWTHTRGVQILGIQFLCD